MDEEAVRKAIHDEVAAGLAVAFDRFAAELEEAEDYFMPPKMVLSYTARMMKEDLTAWTTGKPIGPMYPNNEVGRARREWQRQGLARGGIAL